MIKHIFVFLGFSFLYAFSAFSQDCAFFFPVREGAELEIRHYNAKDKLESISTQKVLKKKGTSRDMSVDAEVRSLDGKGKELFKKVITLKCKNGVFCMDMSNFMPGDFDQMGEMEGMEVKIDAKELRIPGNMSVGQKLEDSEMTITIGSGGMTVMTATVKIINRKVEAIEKITTPAGTFSCYKITQDIETNAMITMKMKSVEWMAKDVGMVRSEQYDENNKLQSYSVLNSIKY